MSSSIIIFRRFGADRYSSGRTEPQPTPAAVSRYKVVFRRRSVERRNRAGAARTKASGKHPRPDPLPSGEGGRADGAAGEGRGSKRAGRGRRIRLRLTRRSRRRRDPEAPPGPRSRPPPQTPRPDPLPAGEGGQKHVMLVCQRANVDCLASATLSLREEISAIDLDPVLRHHGRFVSLFLPRTRGSCAQG